MPQLCAALLTCAGVPRPRTPAAAAKRCVPLAKVSPAPQALLDRPAEGGQPLRRTSKVEGRRHRVCRYASRDDSCEVSLVPSTSSRSLVSPATRWRKHCIHQCTGRELSSQTTASTASNHPSCATTAQRLGTARRGLWSTAPYALPRPPRAAGLQTHFRPRRWLRTASTDDAAP